MADEVEPVICAKPLDYDLIDPADLVVHAQAHAVAELSASAAATREFRSAAGPC